MKNERFKLVIFLLYTIIYETMIWGLFLYLIIYENWNEWTIIVAIMMSGAQLKPKHFGLNYQWQFDKDKD